MAFDAAEQGAQVVGATLLGGVTVHGAEMEPVDAGAVSRDDLEIGACWPAHAAPDVSGNFHAAHEGGGVCDGGRPMRHPARLRELPDDRGLVRLLKNGDVRS